MTNNWLRKLTDTADLYGETVFPVPVAELADDNRLLIENHMGIIAYECNRIEVKVHYGTICIEGYLLELVQITGKQLVILGKIESINLHREAGK